MYKVQKVAVQHFNKHILTYTQVPETHLYYHFIHLLNAALQSHPISQPSSSLSPLSICIIPLLLKIVTKCIYICKQSIVLFAWFSTLYKWNYQVSS